jgi:hypothetical protein
MSGIHPNFPLTLLPFLGEALDLQKIILPAHAFPASRPSVTIGKRQMSQKSRANRRKARRKA